jgi:glycosyltransferase involved in cell wall biosynthesis
MNSIVSSGTTATQTDAPQARIPKVAIVHDWLVIYGGAERVLEHIIDMYPQADIFSLIDFVPEQQRHFLRGKTPNVSFLQKIPTAAKNYPKFLPLMPLAIEQFDLSSYDLVISSSYCVAKGVLTGPNQVHVCYCHSPMRYAWDHYHEYLREMHLQSGLKSWFARWQLHKIRTWDVRSNNSVDHFVSNSRFVARRIAKFYGRESHIVNPPIDTKLFNLTTPKEEYYVTAGRFAPFKRLDIVAKAFSLMPDKKLFILGDGPEMEKIRACSGPNVVLTGFLPPSQVKEHLSKAKAFLFPSEEDFGIVPVEAQACGTPVIAFGSGGALETVIGQDDPKGRQPTGHFFYEQSPQAIVEAVHEFERKAQQGLYDPAFIHEHAQFFAIDSFKTRFAAEVQFALTRHEQFDPS